MSKTFEQGREEVARLCKYFAANRLDFFAAGVKEAHVRQSLIDPFFEALGWDMRNAAMTALQYREVIPEDSLEIEGQQKAPDYTFRLGTLAKFYTEAKKCGININADPGPAYQLRRYGWSAKIPLSILTDFEELGIYDCSLRPRPTDKASFGRIQYFRDEEYPDRWRELWDIFSREAVWAGAYDRYAASKRKRGTSEVDSEFLKEIEGWRDSLARNIALRNLYLGYDDLNTTVQRTIDRLIFLRMAEDRGSESYGQLLKLCEQPEIYSQFIKLCRKADEKYNSGIFHFKKEEGVSEQPDQFTPALTIDDKIIKPILQSLYFENGSPYHFGVLPVEILGTVYERFLGKVIRLTHDHRAKVEEKPEVRKAGGVYYTPAYIVNYIVTNTVGKMIEGKSPAQLAGGKSGQPLRVLDMACGSGSFLLGAYQCLLDHCLKWYLENRPEKQKEAVYFDARRKFWRLTITEKKRILTTHIFGVDIDLQAVEVSKLSLLLKVLEGETDETVGQSRQLFHERALPNLSNNIKCGNSLIGPDYFSEKMFPDSEELLRIKPFDWANEFSAIMAAGGFDAVFGNPPWAFSKYVDWGDETKSYIQQKYLSTRSKVVQSRARQAGKINLFAIFALKAINVLRRDGLMGIILPNNILRTTVYDVVRKQILEISTIQKIVDLKAGVFQGVTASTVIIILEANLPIASHSIEIVDNQILGIVEDKVANKLNQADCLKNPSCVIDIFLDTSLKRIINKADAVSTKLGEIADVLNGIATEKNMAGILDGRKNNNSKPILFGKDIVRYHFEHSGKYVNYVRAQLLRARDESIFLAPQKLIMQRIGGILVTAYDNHQYYTFNSVNNLLLKSNSQYSLKYLLGILNSKLLRVYYIARFTNKSSLTVNVSKTFIDQLPIRTVNFSDFSDKAHHEKMEQLVESMLALSKHKVEARTQAEQKQIQRQFDATDREIDLLVYELYGLTEKEIRIVENTGS